MSYTKGPWKLSEMTGEVEVMAPCGRSLFLMPYDADENVLDDARLISAAPDLLEALKAALMELREYEFDISGEIYNNPVINAAISKATGES